MSAIVDLVREALKDRGVREEIRSILLEDGGSKPANDVELIEPLIDAREAGKSLGVSPAAVRAAAFRKTIPSVHVGRLPQTVQVKRVLRRNEPGSPG